LSLSLNEIREFQENNYDSDHLASGLSEREAHNGPFEVDTDLDGWLKEVADCDRKTLTQEKLVSLRLKVNIGTLTITPHEAKEYTRLLNEPDGDSARD